MRRLLGLLTAIERGACLVSFIVMSAALIADVGSRLVFGSGLLGAPQVGVIGMIALSMFGMGLAADTGSHLRPRFFDGLWPDRWEDALRRLADAIGAVFYLLIGVLAVFVVAESIELGDVTSVLRWPIWPLQTMIAAAFLMNALRYAVYVARPELRPAEDLESSVEQTIEAEGR